MKRKFLIIIGLLLLFAAVMPTAAQQQTSPPPEVEAAFNALETRLGQPVNFQTITSVTWDARDFNDASLGCPTPGQVYAQVITPGYQVLVTYAGTTYDYRVAEGSQNAILCDSYPAQPILPTPTATPEDDFPQDPVPPCPRTYEVTPDDVLFEIAVRCGTTVEALMAANPDIEDPALIYAGQRIVIPDERFPLNVSIAPDSGPAGTTVTLSASGFPSGVRVEVGLGRAESEYDVIARREINRDGTLSALLTIPLTADPDEEWVGVVVLNNQETVSEEFLVTEGEVAMTPLPTRPQEGASFEQTQIYLVAVGDGGRSGMEIGCGDSLVPVTVDIAPTTAPLTAALEQIFAIDERTYEQSGLYNALYRSDLQVDGIDIDNAEAIIALSGDLRIGGVCDNPRVMQQLRQTALQYSTIDSVTITVNGEPLEDVLALN
ncbi:MAG: LysM peptidoglycan-binding domain-containing protein [Chloroflexota bacterium]